MIKFMINSAICSVLAGVLLLGTCAAGAAQDGGDAAGRVEVLDRGVGEANLAAGSYREAVAEYRAALKKDPRSRCDRYGLALTLLETGGYEEAGKVLGTLVDAAPAVAGYALRLAELQLLRGRQERGEALLRKVLVQHPGNFEASARLGRLERVLGRPEKAAEHFGLPVREAAKRVITDPEELLYLGWCYRGLGRIEDASKVFVEAFGDEDHGDPELYPAYVSLIDLYLENHHVFGATPPYLPVREEAFRNNPNYAELHLVLADVYLARMERGRARESLDKALAVNPRLTHGLCLKASFALDRMDFAGAAEWLRKAGDVDPVGREVASYRACLAWVRGDRAAAEKEWKALLAVDPRYGVPFFLLADLLGDIRRYQEAYAFARRAVETDPKLWKGWDAVGRFALYLGRETEAVAALERARDGDPYGDKHLWRHNMLELFSHMDEFLVTSWGPFKLRLHSEDNPILRRYLREALDEAYRELTRKYGFKPKDPIRVEVFSHARDFAVRTIGVPGIYGVLGACFGQVITMNSPRALPAGSYVWKATLWHEFAHVITLQMSSYRVSRWLTEGLSVYEEKCCNPAWEEPQDVRLMNALANGTVAPVIELDGLFRSRRISFAYLQSLTMVEFIIERMGGFAKMPQMLAAYGNAHDTRRVLKDVLGVTPEQFDRAFLTYLEEKFRGQHIQTTHTRKSYETARDTLDLDAGDRKALRTVAWYWFQQGKEKFVDCEAALGRLLARYPQDPSGLALRGALSLRKRQPERARKLYEQARKLGRDEFYLRLDLARIALVGGKQDQAIEHLLRAKALVPRYAGAGNPYLQLARIYREKGDAEASRREVAQFVRLVATDVEGRLQLADHHLEAGEWERALVYLHEANQVMPYEVRVHLLLARALAGLKRFEAALEEIDLAVLLAEEAEAEKKPEKSALPDLRLERARILRTMGARARAKAEAEAARKKYPDHAGLKAFLQGKASSGGPDGK